MLKGKNLQPGILYQSKLSFRFEGEIKSFTDKKKLRVHHKTDLTRNAKGSSLSRKERPWLETKKIMKEKNLIAKGKHTVKGSGSTIYKASRKSKRQN